MYNVFAESLTSAHLSGSDVKLGDRVIVQSSQGSKAGVLRYYGNTEFGSGLWCGVELDEPLGKNDGTVAGVRFVIPAKCGFEEIIPFFFLRRSPVYERDRHRERMNRIG